MYILSYFVIYLPIFKNRIAVNYIQYWRNSYKMLVQKPEGKNSIARHWYKWENIKMDPTEICCTYMCGLD